MRHRLIAHPSFIQYLAGLIHRHYVRIGFVQIDPNEHHRLCSFAAWLFPILGPFLCSQACNVFSWYQHRAEV
jgi:hypothetical protein